MPRLLVTPSLNREYRQVKGIAGRRNSESRVVRRIAKTHRHTRRLVPGDVPIPTGRCRVCAAEDFNWTGPLSENNTRCSADSNATDTACRAVRTKWRYPANMWGMRSPPSRGKRAQAPPNLTGEAVGCPLTCPFCVARLPLGAGQGLLSRGRRVR